jgi:hypothetical protein
MSNFGFSILYPLSTNHRGLLFKFLKKSKIETPPPPLDNTFNMYLRCVWGVRGGGAVDCLQEAGSSSLPSLHWGIPLHTS